MLKRIMVPLDFSGFAEHALGYALGLARRTQATLQLVSVLVSLPPELTTDEIHSYQAKTATLLGRELPNRVTRDVIPESPAYPPPDPRRVAHLLSCHAHDIGTDIIIMATHGHGGVRRAMLGSVADSLVRIASHPVLLIRPHGEAFDVRAAPDRELNHIVIAVDGSTSAEQVIPYALQLGRPFGADYSLLRVTTPVRWTGVEPVTTESGRTRLQPADYLEMLATGMRRQGAAVTTRVLDGFSPGPSIVQYANRHAADVIALATSGHGRVHRLLLGSVADRVVRTSEVPVLVCNTRALARMPIHEPVAADAGAMV
jgi:nucleotide-binding universal stress UspA family protein